MLVIPDTCILGVLVNPKETDEVRELRLWMRSHLLRGVRFTVAALVDYELRRNLILENLADSLNRLNELRTTTGFLPLTDEAMKRAASLWAESRRRGKPTGHKYKLDGDAILAAQAIIESGQKERVLIATINLGHLKQFATSTVDARRWQDI